jgi:hypothetical protein
MTAKDVIALLAQRHRDDVFVTECKNGSTQYANNVRLDAWVLKRQWVKPLVIGYEVKVSRADFLRDTKWRLYLPYCNQFFFAAPAGVIDPRELPPEAGLLVVTRTGDRLLTKKPAGRREVVIPEDLYRYILMCRVQVKREDCEGKWQEWREMRERRRELGRWVGLAIKTDMCALGQRNRSLEQDIARMERTIARLEKGKGHDETL